MQETFLVFADEDDLSFVDCLEGSAEPERIIAPDMWFFESNERKQKWVGLALENIFYFLHRKDAVWTFDGGL